MPPHLDFVWTAFAELRTDRREGFAGPGPIPFSAVALYASCYGIEGLDDLDRFVRQTRMLDEEYLAIIFAKAKRPSA